MKTIKTRTLFLLTVLTILFSSCQKEVSLQDDVNPTSTPNNAILGKWKFVGLNAKTITSISYVEMGMLLKAIALSDYDTKNNVGDLEITNDKFFFKGIGHTVSTDVEVQTYIDGVNYGTTMEHVDYTTDPADDTYDYVRNNNDSLTFINARAMLPDLSGGSTPTPPGPIGARISIVSDTLFLVVESSMKNTALNAGVPTTYTAQFRSTMKFKR
jgi:hypothetical protein